MTTTRDFLDLCSTVPYGEGYIQVGHPDSIKWGKLEAHVYKEQLIRQLGPCPEGASFKVVLNPHDFGSYVSLTVVFETHNEVAVQYAYDCKGASIEEWDTPSRKKLQEAGYPFDTVR